MEVVKGDSQENTQPVVETTAEAIPEYQFISTEDAKSMTDEGLDAKLAELEEVAVSFGNEMKTKKYRVKVGEMRNAKNLAKFIEKNVKWAHNTLPSYISVCHGVKDGIKEGLTEDGFLLLGGSTVGLIYQTMIQVSGTGYFEAKEYLRILTEVGEGVSNSMKELADDNTHLRNIHQDLATLDTEKIARAQGIEVAADVTPDESGQ